MTLSASRMAHNVVIRASAGTGKTYALVQTVVHLLAGLTHHERSLLPRELVAITFTEKAAKEMLGRIRAQVDALARDDAAALGPLRDSARELGRDLPRASFWQSLRASLDELVVATFHSYCLSLLRRYPLEAGLDPAFGVLDEATATGRFDELADRVVIEALQDPALRPGVSELLYHVPRYISPYHKGLGTLLTARLAEIHESATALAALHGPPGSPLGSSLENQLCETFQILLERLEATFNAEKVRLGQVDFGDMLRLTRHLLRDHPTVRREVKSRLAVLLVDELQDTNPLQRDLVLMLAEPVTHEHNCQEADWPLHRGPDGQLLSEIRPDYHLGARRLFAVGDPKQSIYDFRGADVSIFTQLEALVLREGASSTALRENRRSRPSLIEASNAYLSRLLRARPDEDRPWYVHWSQDAALVAARSQDLPGSPPVHLVSTDEKLNLGDEMSAVAELIREVVEGPRPWEIWDGNLQRRARYRDITILLRRFYGVLPELQFQFERRGLPYYVVKGGGFYQAAEIADAAVMLRALSASVDETALVGWLRGPMIGVSDEALALLAMRQPEGLGGLLAHIGSHRDVLAGLTPRDTEALALAAELWGQLSTAGEAIGPANVLDLVLARTHFLDVLAALPQGDQAIANLARLRQLADTYHRRTGGGLIPFARLLERLIDREPPSEAAQITHEEADVVRVMTIHQSKGLDCPIAIISDADPKQNNSYDGVLFSRRLGLGVRIGDSENDDPRYRACMDEHRSRKRAELRRQMYVAFTRARDHVVLTGRAPSPTVNGRADADPSWRALLEEMGGESPSWLEVIPVAELSTQTVGVAPTPAPLDEHVRQLAEQALARPRPSGGRLVSAVTQLGDFQICPRRYWLSWEMGVPTQITELSLGRPDPEITSGELEQLPASESQDEAPWPADPIDKGTFAHALLEHVDLERWPSTPSERVATLRHLAESLGTSLSAPDAGEVIEAVHAALAGPLGVLLREHTGAERELPFFLPVFDTSAQARPTDPATSLFLRGQIDLWVPARTTGEPHHVIDYKFSRPRASLDKYRFQLLCYALACHRRLGSPAEASYQASIVFLRSAKPAPRPLPAPLTARDLEAFAPQLARLGSRLLAARQTHYWPRLSPDEYHKTCRETSCRFRPVCFPQGVPAPNQRAGQLSLW